MTWRELPPAEWGKLQGTEAGPLVSRFDPEATRVVVVEDGDRVVGCWVLMRVVHAECIWIAEDQRKHGRVARALLTGMRRIARLLGAKAVWTAAVSPDVEDLIPRIGGSQIPGTHWVVPVQE